MWRQFIVQGNTIYLDILPKMLSQYNNTKHSSIKMTPIEASKRRMKVPCISIYMAIWSNCHLSPNSKLAIRSELVSTREWYLIKGTHLIGQRRYSFLVDKIQSTNPITYRLKDLNNEEIQGSFYELELLPAKQDIFRIEKVIQRDYKKKQALVKWLSYSDDFNSWIPLSNLQKLSNP